jgi:hypothetical protein
MCKQNTMNMLNIGTDIWLQSGGVNNGPLDICQVFVMFKRLFVYFVSKRYILIAARIPETRDQPSHKG